MSSLRLIGAMTFAALALASGARADVLVVDPGGGDGTALLTAALNEAVDGDVILVRAGSYTSFASPTYYTITGKGLTLIADAVAPPELGPLTIQSVPAGSTVVVRGFTLGPATVPSSLGVSVPGLRAQNDAGTVWVEDCTINGTDGSSFAFIANTNGSAAVVVDGSPAVTLQRSTLNGGRGADYSAPSGIKLYATSGGAGLRASGSSSVAAYDCVLLGGAGGNGQVVSNGTESGSGGDGAFVLSSSTLHLAGCSLTGASNGSNPNEWDLAGCGLRSETLSATTERGSSFTPAALVGNGIPAVPVSPPSALTSYPAAPRSFEVTSPLAEGASGTIDVQGQPGDAVTLLIGLETTWTPLASKQGVLLLNPSPVLLLMALGSTTLSGNLSIGFTMPNLPAALEGLTLPLQLLVSSGDGLTLESASALTWLDSGL